MKLDILTPEKIVFEGEVTGVNLSTRTGHITVLSNHTALVSAVKEGEIKVKTLSGEEKVFVNERGVLQTANNKTVLLLRKCVEKCFRHTHLAD